jgi:hypothetical protein
MSDGLVGGSLIPKFESDDEVELGGMSGHVTIVPCDNPSEDNGSVIAVVRSEKVGNAFRMGFENRKPETGVAGR